jgi:hypothetical protein
MLGHTTISLIDFPRRANASTIITLCPPTCMCRPTGPIHYPLSHCHSAACLPSCSLDGLCHSVTAPPVPPPSPWMASAAMSQHRLTPLLLPGWPLPQCHSTACLPSLSPGALCRSVTSPHLSPFGQLPCLTTVSAQCLQHSSTILHLRPDALAMAVPIGDLLMTRTDPQPFAVSGFACTQSGMMQRHGCY